MLKDIYTFLFVDDLIDPAASRMPGNATSLKRKLRQDLTRVILCSYMLLIFNPVMPVIADKMAHTFWEEYHLITVHHVYGNMHVGKEIADYSKRADKDKAPGSAKASQEASVHLISHVAYNFSPATFTSRPYNLYKIHFTVTYIDIQYQPPKA